MKTLQDMKIEIELLKKAKTELKLKMKNLGSHFGWGS